MSLPKLIGWAVIFGGTFAAGDYCGRTGQGPQVGSCWDYVSGVYSSFNEPDQLIETQPLQPIPEPIERPTLLDNLRSYFNPEEPEQKETELKQPIQKPRKFRPNKLF